ncbi:MAG: tyrosine-type recombinase/integrase, partial [Puniceicoccales bacterium]
MHVFKQRRRQGANVVTANHYSGSYRLPWMDTKTTVALKTQDKEIATKRLRQLIQVRELEHEGKPVPSHLWGAPKRDIGKLLEEYRSTVASKGRNSKHVHDTVKRVETLAAACGWVSIDAISPNDFERWRASAPVNPRTHRKLSIKTVNEYLVSVRSFINWLRKLGYLERDPLEFVQKGETRGNEEKRRRVWTSEDLNAFMERGKPPYRADYRVAVWLLAWTGLRKKELQGLRWGEVSFDSKYSYLVVRAEQSKNRKRERVRLMAQVADRLLEMRPVDYKPTDKVLTFRIPGSEQLKADLARAGVDYRNEEGDLDFHALRFTFGHWLATQGAG